MFSILIKKIYLSTSVSFFYHLKHTYQTHILYFLNTEKCCLNHDTKHFFFFLLTLKTCFSTTLFKPQFSHLFKAVFGSRKSIFGKYSIFEKYSIFRKCYFPERKMFLCVWLYFKKFSEKYFLVFGKCYKEKDKTKKTNTAPRLTLAID